MTTTLSATRVLLKGSKVRFRPESTMPDDYGIPRDEVGTIVEVADPLPVGPIDMVRAEFPSCSRQLPLVFCSEYVPA